jgi:hypothetical protein
MAKGGAEIARIVGASRVTQRRGQAEAEADHYRFATAPVVDV